MKPSPDIITELLPNQIFVFGSNQSGRHGKGAAKRALTWGAKWGQAEGLQGRTYGIPTKNHNITKVLPLALIRSYVMNFTEFAKDNPHLEFLVTEIGCGLSKLTPKDIAPMFIGCIGLENVYLPHRFINKLKQL
jgi:hypothetical protein